MSERAGRSHPQFEWVKAKSGSIPPNAVQGGQEGDGKPLFVARAMFNGSLVPGKAGPHIRGASIAYGGKEHFLFDYEILVGDESLLYWRQCTGRIQLRGWSPLEVGYEADGKELYVGKTQVGSGVVIGKVGEHFPNGLMYTYAYKEKAVSELDYYYVLAVPNNVSS
ncbi:hypothetical protein K502DRAFT_309057 [Neoconidiobolus thromboides FSU 785]|nr:hypothetical protein K502DRAFT_309057 [Neoconidiobolus thromboides FSU 785]